MFFLFSFTELIVHIRRTFLKQNTLNQGNCLDFDTERIKNTALACDFHTIPMYVYFAHLDKGCLDARDVGGGSGSSLPKAWGRLSPRF